MTVADRQTTPPGRARETGPARFQRPEQAPPRPAVLRSIGAALLLLLIVVAIPAALLWLDGVPHLPTSVPTREQLTATIGPEQVLSVLVWVVWLAWLQFAICVLVELRSALSGVGLPARVPLSGPSQRFAQILVASVLLLVTAVGPTSAVARAPMHLPEHGSQTVAVATVGESGSLGVIGGDASASVHAGDASTASVAAVTYRLGDLELSPEEGAALLGRKVLVVQPPEGRHHDNLWSIAERSLGDGRRYQELFELNKGRLQDDGRELTLARLIHPNWLMIMPADAVGVERVVAVQTPALSAPAGLTSASAGLTQPSGNGVTDAGTTTVDPAPGAVDATDVIRAQSDANNRLLGAGLLAFCVLAAIEQLRRRRRTPEPSEEAVELEVALRVGADPDRAAALDRSLRHLAGVLRETGRDLPGVYAATVDDVAVTLHLAPMDNAAPAPWQAHDDGRRWVLDVGAHLGVGRRPAIAPFPGLVSLGRDALGADVLVDLEAAQGPVAVVGDPTAALEVATALAMELATNRWSDRLRVTGVDLPTELCVLDPARYRAVGSVEDVLPELRERRADILGSGVLSGRLRQSGPSAWMPEYLILGVPPEGAAVAEILDLAATEARSPLGVVCVGEFPGARWRLEVDSSGSLAVHLLGLNVTGNRLNRAQVAAVAELLTPSPEPDHLDESRVALENEGTVGRPDVDLPEHLVDLAGFATAAVRVQVLGAPGVEAHGVIDAERVALATELVVHLALHPDGVHPTVLAASLWPRGVTPEVRDATVERARVWLGVDGAGVPHLRQGGDGRLRLGPGVVLDWDVVRTLLARSRTVGDLAEERRLLTHALRLAHGAVLAEWPAGHYAWLTRVRLERASRDLLVDAAHRLAIVCWCDDDPGAAGGAARAGLRVAPTEELLWRDLLRATAATGGAAAVQEVAAELELALHSAGLGEMAAPTAALVDEFLPGGSDPGRAVAGQA